jgi:drug/metabolite transporter (DMT)-like permease
MALTIVVGNQTACGRLAATIEQAARLAMSKLQANCLLLLAAAFWGFGNVAQKTVLEHLDPLSASSLRCLIAGVLVAPLAFTERFDRLNRAWWASLLRVSGSFAVALAIQQASYAGTTVTNASFLVNTATVMTPIAAWLLLGQRPAANVALAACMTLCGALLLSGGLTREISSGDYAMILSAACYAVWMVELGRHAQTYGLPFTTCAAQFLGAALLLMPLGLLSGSLSSAAIEAAAPELVILGVFSTAFAFCLQTVAQRFTTASHAAVIVSAESVFGAAGAAWFLGERIAPAGAIGATLVLIAIVYLAASSSAAERPSSSGRRVRALKPN